MGEPGKRDVSRTHSLFVDDLKVYQESHNLLKEINEVIVQASLNTVLVLVFLNVQKLCLNMGKL